ncbi:PEP-CTERM sorting domain-containing protein [Rhodopirellula sp. MGV]|uniref:PEP-CTERM sorting domain-containing protein n=1 Tax=Rhodopirellula sp. MGV TaxID=2023130 RepID=UPI000B968489|nr:PEP-CTERM sorting domain-containing protein [Rhodopirellula sp. MGV]OYP32305.1 hypothetical protein CGZ80_19760 [Rhodopirellula sp. MGV]PNY35910.1 PEP-CTERM sorting domain-containing protein [Rhodopirellula baltica]
MLKRICVAVIAAALLQTSASAEVVFSDDFSYADGPLAGNGNWVGHSGTLPLDVVSGAAVINHGSGSRQDVNWNFADFSTGIISYQFDMVVDSSGPFGSGTDFEYFAHFGNTPDGGTTVDGGSFSARLDITAPTSTGDFSIGISSAESTADFTTAQGFTFGSVVSVLVDYNLDTLTASLTVGGETVTGLVGDAALPINTFALRQSTSSNNESVTIDNLIVSHVTAIPEPSSMLALGVLGAFGAVRRRRRK